MSGQNSNNNKYNKPVFHKTVHWRKMKAVIKAFAKYENIDINEYNLNKITCYQSLGDSFHGNNVRFSNAQNASCFVFDNRYDMFEIPSVKNSGKLVGNFMFLAHNTSFDYWVFGTFKHSIDKGETKRRRILVEEVSYNCCGYYSLSFEDGDNFRFFKKTSSENAIKRS